MTQEKPAQVRRSKAAEIRITQNEQTTQAVDALQVMLETGDASTGQYSVDNCAIMLKFWTGRMLEASKRYQATGNMMAFAAMKQASEQAGEWEKRKAGALIGVRVDLLKDVISRLDAQDKLASELEEIEE